MGNNMHQYLRYSVCVVVLILITSPGYVDNTREDEIVAKWATDFGDELWNLGNVVTKFTDIKYRYKQLNARVLKTDGEAVLNSMVENVNRMLKQKMDAVMCIMDKAEELSESFNYTEHRFNKFAYHNVKGEVVDDPGEPLNLTGVTDEPPYSNIILNMSLTEDRHFFNIPVNTDYSVVHLPINVYEGYEDVRAGLMWSEALDQVFRDNYQSDPTLLWQYFGAAKGFLRTYPALKWMDQNEESSPEDLIFDCRNRQWYIQATTCSKDVIILIDNSGSMAGMRNTTAKLVLHSLLQTFSNNDFVNIFKFNLTVDTIVPCLGNDSLVQATPENINLFKQAVVDLGPEGKANFSAAFVKAFQVLKKYREIKSCPEKICNQAIMLVTDSVPGNLTEVFDAFNRINDSGTEETIPVRVFTYLVGKEVTNVREIQWMACLNRGYYVHIHNLEEVREDVLKYIPVMARPLVLQAEQHPTSWAHLYADITQKNGSETSGFQKYRMLTSVSVPAYDKKINNNNETTRADILGVAGTDVPISDFLKLTMPYKIGVNGYAFIITNNGYVLLHPDLRPAKDGRLKENYNSVDLTEIELLDDNVTFPRQPSKEILKLRDEMIQHKEGSMQNLAIKFHYDDMRRVGSEKRHYYYAPLKNTPFSMGLALPDIYGSFWIKAGDEIKKSIQMGVPLVSFFKGNWRIHPDWVYCDYHWESKTSFESKEAKLIHFLEKMSMPGWKWYEQYPPEDMSSNDKYDSFRDTNYSCRGRPIKDDEFFCDKEMMQLLVFDAKATEASYRTSKWAAKSRLEVELVEKYNASLRFVATQGGLTRWQYIKEPPADEKQFGETDLLALEENWYKSAVLQHHLNPEAFVFSVPHKVGLQSKDKDFQVTASHAIFTKDGGHEAPGSVVGLKLSHAALSKRFFDFTSKTCRDCSESCSSDELDCYVIDGNGYVIISENNDHTGLFFGEMEGAIMESMVFKNIFRKIRIFDYQAMCYKHSNTTSTASFLSHPVSHISSLIKWAFFKVLWVIAQSLVFAQDVVEIEDDESSPRKPLIDVQVLDIPVACDNATMVYQLQNLAAEGYHSSYSPMNCTRPFYVKRIPHTNLLLIVVNGLYQSCYRRSESESIRIQYNSSANNQYDKSHFLYNHYLREDKSAQDPACNKHYINLLPRRRMSGCFNQHPKEKRITLCGSGTSLSVSFVLVVILISALSWLS
uniref:Voltage-dependent calcium channel subunit alpha-2/delta-4 n=1 Tax=Cacopsylla melanoneura TaxID=428564 RepID=A0A8D8WFM7_9HEMI